MSAVMFAPTPKFVAPVQPSSLGDPIRKSELIDPMTYKCPTCGADPGQNCTSRADGQILYKVHMMRACPESRDFY